jgi:hypothetical protein
VICQIWHRFHSSSSCSCRPDLEFRDFLLCTGFAGLGSQSCHPSKILPSVFYSQLGSLCTRSSQHLASQKLLCSLLLWRLQVLSSCPNFSPAGVGLLPGIRGVDSRAPGLLPTILTAEISVQVLFLPLEIAASFSPPSSLLLARFQSSHCFGFWFSCCESRSRVPTSPSSQLTGFGLHAALLSLSSGSRSPAVVLGYS